MRGEKQIQSLAQAAINILRLGRSRWASTPAAAGVAQEAAGL